MTRSSPPLSSALREGFRLAAPVLAAGVLGVYLLTAQLGVDARQPYRLLAALPVAIAAYRPRGYRPGLGYAAGFGSLFLWEAGWAFAKDGLSSVQP